MLLITPVTLNIFHATPFSSPHKLSVPLLCFYHFFNTFYNGIKVKSDKIFPQILTIIPLLVLLFPLSYRLYLSLSPCRSPTSPSPSPPCGLQDRPVITPSSPDRPAEGFPDRLSSLIPSLSLRPPPSSIPFVHNGYLDSFTKYSPSALEQGIALPLTCLSIWTDVLEGSEG